MICGLDIDVLEYENSEMFLFYGSAEDLNGEYNLSEQIGRKQLYDDFFESFDNEYEFKQKSEKFEKLNNNLYYIYGGIYDESFRLNQRVYIVGNSKNSTVYVFYVEKEGKFTKTQEESILKVLSTIKSK